MGLLKFLITGIVDAATGTTRPERIGERGERKVHSVIGDNISGEKYVLNNLTIATNGKTTQIDHVVITKVGVFVIETKNHKF